MNSQQKPCVGILDFNISNLASVAHAIDYLGFDYITLPVGAPFLVSCDEATHWPEWPEEVTHIIIPGVGNYGVFLGKLPDSVLKKGLRQWARAGRPLLGICLGMQLLFEGSEEALTSKQYASSDQKADTSTAGPCLEPGLGLMPGRVTRLSGQNRLPHIGWNQVEIVQTHPILKHIKADRDFYFVHSFAVTGRHDITLATTHYNQPFSSIVAQGSVLGVQFHPEKSQKNGLQLLENFCLWQGAVQDHLSSHGQGEPLVKETIDSA